MINIGYWCDNLSDYETSAFISWLIINGVNSPDELAPFIKSLTSGITLSSFSFEDLLTVLNRVREGRFKRIPEAHQYHITIAFGKLIKWCFEDDILAQTIDLPKAKKQLSEALEPLGIDCSFLFSYYFNLKERAIEETLELNKSRWPFDPHMLDHFYDWLLFYKFIEPSGHFKAMFMVENPPMEHRIIWKKNRTDLIYLGYRLYFQIYSYKYIDIINRIFCKKNKNGQIATLQQLKKTNRNIRDQFNPLELKGNWTTIDQIFQNIPLP